MASGVTSTMSLIVNDDRVQETASVSLGSFNLLAITSAVKLAHGDSLGIIVNASGSAQTCSIAQNCFPAETTITIAKLGN
jgi:hypothetical protein